MQRNVERAKGVEPLPETWRAPILPVKLHPHNGFTRAGRVRTIPLWFIGVISFGGYALGIYFRILLRSGLPCRPRVRQA